MFSRVLIVSASAGNGHVKAAEAVEAAVRASGTTDVLNIDALKYATASVRRAYSKGYIRMVNKMPAALGWMYDALDTPWKNERRRLAFHKLTCSRLLNLMEKYQPEVIISTHFLASELASYLLCKGRIKSASAIVVTDLDAHAMWLCHHFDRYFVPLEETRQHMSRLGIPEQNITVSGIPINPVFAQAKDKQAMRQQFGLDPNLTTILLSTGGMGVGPIDQLTEALQQLRQPVQVLAMCGKNTELQTKLGAIAANAAQGVRILPVGYTNKMDEYMSASDIVMGKPGGLTTSEALAKQLAFVIVNPIPGQEERNSDHLLEQGVAIRCNNLPALAYKLDELLANPDRIKSMQANAARMSRPNAAAHIVRTLEEAPAGYGGTISARCPTCKKQGPAPKKA